MKYAHILDEKINEGRTYKQYKQSCHQNHYPYNGLKKSLQEKKKSMSEQSVPSTWLSKSETSLTGSIQI